MKLQASLALAAALCAATPAVRGAVGPPPAPRAPEDLKYVTACAAAEPTSVDGFVTNQSLDQYTVNGEVRFTFSIGGTMSRPDILVFVDGGVRPAETARVARARINMELKAGESCTFDVASAIRKSGF